MRTPLFSAIAAALLALPTSAWAVLDVDAGPDVTLECESVDGAEYTLNGTIPELEGITFEWTTAPVVDLADDDTLTPTGVFPLGETLVTLSAETVDDSGSDDATVTVEDTTPPVVYAKAKPYFLWPPNHEMHEVKVFLRIRDRCTDEEDFDVELISATSNEPDNGTGDGNTVDDIQDDDIGTDDRMVSLRAERKGNGDGRIYTLLYRVTDASGNSTEAAAHVYVPHDASDLKDLIDHKGGDYGDLEPICPRAEEAAEAFAPAVPSPGDFGDRRSCQNGCRAWSRGCSGIVRGAASCYQSELKALMAIEKLACKQEPDRNAIRACEREFRSVERGARNVSREESRLGRAVCDEVADECNQACDDYFGVEEYVE